MTKEETAALLESGLDRETPYAITNVSQTQFSVARYSGSIKYNDQVYFYDPINDELVRHDVIAWLGKHRLKRYKERHKAEDQLELI